MPPSRPIQSRPQLMSTALAVVGLTIAGGGVGNGVDNIVSHAHGQDWTVSFGGFLVGVGAALLLAAILLRRNVTARWSYLLVVVGAFIAGYALGGGLDNLLSEIDREGEHFAPAMAAVGLGVGLCVAGMWGTSKSASSDRT